MRSAVVDMTSSRSENCVDLGTVEVEVQPEMVECAAHTLRVEIASCLQLREHQSHRGHWSLTQGECLL